MFISRLQPSWLWVPARSTLSRICNHNHPYQITTQIEIFKTIKIHRQKCPQISYPQNFYHPHTPCT